MLQDKVALVTGAGRGIGRAVALGLAAHGARVVVNDLGVTVDGREADDRAALDVVAEIEKAGGTAVASTETVTTWEGGRSAVARAVESFGRIDILVTCAGILRDRMIFNMGEEEFDSVIAVHLKGTFTCIRHAAPLMREQRYGRIITFSSSSGLFGNAGQANYGAAKSAVGGLTKVVARDLGKYGVTVNSICPVAATRMTMTEDVQRARERRERQGVIREDSTLRRLEDLQPEDVAPMVIFLASEFAARVNGQFFLCAGNEISLIAQPRPIKTIYKEERWTLDELDRIVPQTLATGLVNPAPPASGRGT